MVQGHQLILLLAVADLGGALWCYESTCLDDDSLTSCASNNDTIQRECDVEAFRDASRRMNRPLHRIITNLPMTCIKIEEHGLINGEPETGVVRMCYLDLPYICSEMKKDPTDLVEQHSQPLQVDCNVCNTDGCNIAPSLHESVTTLVVGLSLVASRH